MCPPWAGRDGELTLRSAPAISQVTVYRLEAYGNTTWVGTYPGRLGAGP